MNNNELEKDCERQRRREAREEIARKEREQKRIQDSREAAQKSNAKRKRSRKGRGGFAENRNKINRTDRKTAVKIILMLQRMYDPEQPFKLYAPVTYSTSTVRHLCIALGTTPNATNANAIHALIEHFRRNNRWFRNHLERLCSNTRRQKQQVAPIVISEDGRIHPLPSPTPTPNKNENEAAVDLDEPPPPPSNIQIEENVC